MLHSTSIDAKKVLNFVLIKRGSYSGFLNMKIDKLLFENYEKLVNNPEESIIARFYTFSNHTVTLGYFQRIIPEEIKREFNKWFFVRRITGGKAVFHYPKKDLTFCLVSSLNILDKLNIQKGNDKISLIHHFVNNLLWESILPLLKMHTNNQKQEDREINYQERKYKSFNCFEKVHSFEKIYNNHKVIGTAIKISNNKFLVQSNIKMNYLFSNIDEKLISSVENNFLSQIMKLDSSFRYHQLNILDLIKSLKFK